MYVTEEEAREKFCQECFNNPELEMPFCLGSKCMAWQWADKEYETKFVTFHFCSGLNARLTERDKQSREKLRELLEQGYVITKVVKPSRVTEEGKFVRYEGTLYVHLKRKNQNRRGYCGKAMITVEVENC
jgi:hypothetical protein